MNLQMVRFVLGRIMCIIALLMIPSIIVALIYAEGWAGVRPFILSMLITFIPGMLMSLKRPERSEYFMREGFVVVALSWVLLSILGALPFYLSGYISNPVDAIFETASGFTTTGSSILTNVEALSHSMLFWRSFTHLVGGMGVLVFALAVMPKIDSDDVFIMRAEVPGPIFGKIRSRVRSSARILYLIYLAMTLLLIVLLYAGGIPLFDSFVNAFGAAGTGGFGIKNTSIAYYNSAYIEYVLGIGMILFGVNFNLYYALLIGHFKDFFKSEELRWYLGIIAGAIGLIFINTMSHYDSIARQFRDIFFTVSSIITTTGYSTYNYNDWPMFSHVVLLGLMFIGAMAGSTAGGLKISRIAIYVKSTFQEIRRNLSPNRRLALRFEGKKVNNELISQISFYLTTYIGIFCILLLIVSINAPNFVSAFSAVAATFNNIGPGLDVVGPAGNFASLSNLSKVALSIGMVMGRLELFPIIVLFAPSTWRKT